MKQRILEILERVELLILIFVIVSPALLSFAEIARAT